MITHETALTTHQEILKYNRRFAIHTLQSLLYVLGDPGKHRHGFIEHSGVLVHDGLEQSHEAIDSPERITIQVLRVRAVRTYCACPESEPFSHSFIRVEGRC